MEEDDKRLVEIRCPAWQTTKKGYDIRCDHLCCIANAGSLVRIKCRHCKTVFEAYVPDDATSMIDVAYRILRSDKTEPEPEVKPEPEVEK